MNTSSRTHYDTLDISPEATDAQIKKTYRLLARQYHPDHNPDNAAAEARFKQIGQAYDVLGDPDKRAAYDRSLRGYGALDVAASPCGTQSGVHRTAGPQLGDVMVEFTVSAACAAFGCVEMVPIPEGGSCAGCSGHGLDCSRYDTCPQCQGSCGSWAERPARCEWCRGRGRDRNYPGYACGVCSGRRWVMVRSWNACAACSGHGVAAAPCSDCGGDGQAWSWRPVRFPAGVTEGRRLRLRGQAPANDSGVHADVWLVVHIR